MCSSYWGGFSRMAHGRRSSTPYGQPPLWYVFKRFLLHHFTFIFVHLFILLSFYLSFYLSFCYIIYFVFFLGAWAPPADDPLNIAPDESGVYHFTFTVFILFLFLFYFIMFYFYSIHIHIHIKIYNKHNIHVSIFCLYLCFKTLGKSWDWWIHIW